MCIRDRLDPQSTVFVTEFLEEKGYQFTKRLLAKNPNIDAIITTDSLLASGVCDFLSSQNLTIPVLSFDSVDPKLDLAAYVDINTLEPVSYTHLPASANSFLTSS